MARKPRSRAPARSPRLPAAPAAAPRRYRRDDWQNALTGLGVVGRDKRKAMDWQRPTLSYVDLVELYRASDMFARIVDTPADEMTREWVDLQIEGDKETAEDVINAAAKMGVQHLVNEALKKKRAYGGAGLLMLIDDGQKPDKPLREDRIKSFQGFTLLEAVELQGQTYYSDPFAPKFAQVEMFRAVPQLATSNAKFPTQPLVHESRVIRFQGALASKRQIRENFGWGDSVAVRVLEVLQDFEGAYGGAAHLLQDFAQGVFKMKGLAEAFAMQGTDGTSAIYSRLQAIDMARSMVRAAVIDADGEEFERKTTPVAGLSDLLDRFCARLAAAADMPQSRLFGDSPGGMNATGDSDHEWWSKRIKGMQDQEMRAQVERILKLIMLAKDGPTNGDLPDNWTIRFNPLKQLSALEEAQQRFAVAQADNLWVTMGAISGEEVGASHFGGDSFSPELVLDMEMRDKHEESIDRRNEETIGKPDPVEAAKAMAAAVPATVDNPGMPNKRQVIGGSKPKDGSKGGDKNSP